jgi:RHS repeat-associated protein
MARDALGRLNSLTYTLGDGTTTVSDVATRTQSNQVTQDVVTSGSNSLWYNYTYDTAGRLTGTTVGPHSYSYGYGTESSTCNSVTGNNVNAGKNGNRTTQTIDGTTTTFCYDQADRLKSSSNTLYNGGDYDSHGNMTSVGSGTTPLRLCFDSSDRNSCMTQRDSSGNGIAMYYNRDVQGRIVARFKNTLTNWNAAAAGDYFYGFTGSGDTPDFVRDASWTVTEKNLQLPGGVLLTIRPQQTGNAQKQYSLPNIHGDVLLTTDAAGTNTSNGNGPASTFTYDPFGNVLSGSTLPSNADHASYGYVGQHEKLTESEYTTVPMQMGARVYIPGIGRFLQVDPEEGGTPNNYVYPPDPINDFDLTGNFGMKSFANIASVGSMIPGPIGMASAAVSAAAYAAAGDKKNATLMVVGIAAASVGAGAAVKAAQVATKVAPRAGAAMKVAKTVSAVSANGASAAVEKNALQISGYTRHGINQAISRDNHGVSVRAIYDAVHSPQKVKIQAGGKVKYTGKDATVILNKSRKIITTWARNSKGWRY